MGYTTEFDGQFDLDKPLTPEHAAYLRQFCYTRRMRRDAAKTALRPDPIREAVGLPVGEEGAYFVGESGYAGQDDGPDVTDGNSPGGGQPSLQCQWTPNDDGTAIEWDGGEKFYEYVPWIEYLVEHFLGPWGYKLNGVVAWWGEDPGDNGKIVIRNNAVDTVEALNLLEGEGAPLSESELATISAALRFWQKMLPYNWRRHDYPNHFKDVCPLDDSEIDALCERLGAVELKAKAHSRVLSLEMR